METFKTTLINTLLIPIGIGLIILIINLVNKLLPINVRRYIEKNSGMIFLPFIFILFILFVCFMFGNLIMHELGYAYIPIGNIR